MSDKSLAVVKQQTVTFYDDELLAVRATDDHIYVAVSHMCNALGLDMQGQVRRIQRHTVMSDGLTWVDILSTQVQKGTEHTQRRRVRAIRVDLVPLWLSSIQTNMVKEAVRPKLEQFQREAAKVLWEAFQEGRLTSDTSFDELLEADTPAVQAYKTFQALTKLAQSQIILESRVDEHEQRLQRIEASLGDSGRYVTPDQASQISQAVKAVALAAGKKSGRNEFGAVYGELYRKYGITSYKMLPNRRFDEAMKFLTDWYEELTGETAF